MRSDFEKLLADMKPVLGKRAESLRTLHTLSKPETRRSMEAWLQRMAERHLGRQVGETPALLQPPSREAVSGPFTIGRVVYHDRELYSASIDERALMSHVGVFGRTGTGKTNFCLSLLHQLKDRGIPFLIFDWKRNYRDLLADMDDLRVYTVGRSILPFSFQPLIPPPGTSPSIWLKLLIDVIAQAYYVGEGVKYLLLKAIDGVYRETGVYAGSPKVWPTFRDVRMWLEDHKLANARESQWMISTKRTVQSLCYGEMGGVVNKPQQTPIEELLKQNIVLELDALTQTDKAFLTEALLLWIHHYRMQEEGREQLKHVIVIEEAHHVLKESKSSHESIMEITLREIRELGQGIILIDQTPSQIAPTALANTATKVFLNLPHRSDITTAAAALLLDNDQKDFLGQLPVGTAIVKLQEGHFMPFLIRIPLVRIKKGLVSDEELARRFAIKPHTTVVRAAQESSALGTTSPQRENAPLQTATSINLSDTLPKQQGSDAPPQSDAPFDSPYPAPPGLTHEEHELLRDVIKHPYDSGVHARYRRLKISTRRGQNAKKELLGQGLIEEHIVSLPRGTLTLLHLTPQGRRLAQRLNLGTPPARGQSPIHEFWRHKTIQKLQREGYTVEREVQIPGNGYVDLCATRGTERLAIEIETGKSDIKTNLQNALTDGFTGILLVAVTAQAERKTHTLLARLPSKNRNLTRVWRSSDVLQPTHPAPTAT